MSEVRLQFVLGVGLGSALIRWFGHDAPYSHVDFVLPDGRLLGARSDSPVAGKTGVQIRAPNYERWTKRLLISLQSPEADRVYAWAKRQIGCPYDHTAILAFLFDRDWRKTGAWFCSELAAASLLMGGYWGHPWALPTPVNKIAPADLLLLLAPDLTVLEEEG